MKQSKQAEEMLELMNRAESMAITEGKGRLSKEEEQDVHQAAMKTAKKIWGDDVNRKTVKKMAADAIEQSSSPDEAIEIVQNMMQSNEANDSMVWTPNETKGPGAKTYKKGNVYTRDQVDSMLKLASKFTSDGKQLESWKYSQEWLNAVGSTMKQFLDLQKGDPALNYDPAKMQGNPYDWGYSPNKNDKAKADANMAGEGPGPSRGKKMDKSHDINSRRKTGSSRMRTDYNK